ncbi:MAG: cation:proton antiporter [Caldiserica bacterium]|nr:MAG: cation:proton antiporter [Caldisericota bacterium]
MNSLFIIGIVVILGIISGEIFKKIKIPRVVGYILIGVLTGKSILRFIDEGYIEKFSILTFFILGVIGFLIGGELKKDVFKRYGKSIYTILLSEGMAAFIGVTILVYLITKKLYLGLLLGAIASATDPASTVNVLWEYKSRGPLTTTLTSIVALDDALALILYGLVSVFSKALLMHEKFSFLNSIGEPVLEITESVFLGFIVSLILIEFVKRLKDEGIIVAVAFSSIALTVGVAILLKLDLILSSMVLGLTLTNLLPNKSKLVFEKIKTSSHFLNVLFFIIVGSSLDIHLFAKISIVFVVLGYLFGRSIGKILGATFGGIISGAKETVIKYTGISLFTQGGVAMGLAISIAHSLKYLGEEGRIAGSIIINIIAATTFFVQIIGPVLVKYGITKANEAGKNLTEEDIVEMYKVRDVMRRDFYPIREDLTLDKIMDVIKESNLYHYVVVNNNGELVGMISLGHLRSVFFEEELREVVLAEDLVEQVDYVVYEDDTLEKAIEMFRRHNIDFLPVLEKEGSRKVTGVLEYRRVMRWIYTELFRLQHEME